MKEFLQRALGVILGAIIAFILSSTVPAIEFGGLSIPSLVGIANACDEFHGDFNCTCQQSIFNPCCPWWLPLKCAPISPEMKDRAKLWSFGLNAGALYVEPVIVLYGLGCAGQGDYVSCATTLVLMAAKKSLEIGKHWADKFVQDPFDENYGQPYESQFYDPVSLGAPDCGGQDFCEYFNAHTSYTYGFWEAAYVSANRAASCAQVGNEDCFSWQKARMLYFIWAAGVHTGYIGDGLSSLANSLNSQDVSNAAAEVHYVGQLMEVQ